MNTILLTVAVFVSVLLSSAESANTRGGYETQPAPIFPPEISFDRTANELGRIVNGSIAGAS